MAIDVALRDAFERNLSYGAYGRAYECLEMMYEDDPKASYKYVEELRDVLTKAMGDTDGIEEKMKVLKASYLLTARDVFDDYCLYLEWDRPGKTRFYLPRRKQLLIVAQALQDLADDKIDLLAISMPPGTGKTTLAIFFLSWLGGKNPDDPILSGSHNMTFLDGLYRELVRIITPGGEYLWNDVFPDVKIVSTNADELRLDLGKAKRFATYQHSSIGSGNAGKVRAKQLLYCDDLIAGIEEAMNKVQLEKKWVQYTTDLRQRKMGRCKELQIATRWSVHDPIGHLQNEFEGNPRARFIAIPALNENGESNFDYPYGLGFSKEYFENMRNMLDDASFKALYMNEPIEREGLLYSKNELRRYFELPDKTPDAILAVCDTKERGMDYCCMPVVCQYGNDYYVTDILVDNSNPEVVEARIVNMLIANKVQMARFESNVAGGRIAEKIQQLVRERGGGRCKITTKYTTANKETKIITRSPWVKEHCLFKDDLYIANNREYRKALDFLCSYTMAGKNKFDDVPDAFAQLADFCDTFTVQTVSIVRRPF